jgi:hypothetical protein
MRTAFLLLLAIVAVANCSRVYAETYGKPNIFRTKNGLNYRKGKCLNSHWKKSRTHKGYCFIRVPRVFRARTLVYVRGKVTKGWKKSSIFAGYKYRQLNIFRTKAGLNYRRGACRKHWKKSGIYKGYCFIRVPNSFKAGSLHYRLGKCAKGWRRSGVFAHYCFKK